MFNQMKGTPVTVKNALHWLYKWVTKLPYFIEEVYNQRRLNLALGYLPPNEFDKILLNQENTD